MLSNYQVDGVDTSAVGTDADYVVGVTGRGNYSKKNVVAVKLPPHSVDFAAR